MKQGKSQEMVEDEDIYEVAEIATFFVSRYGQENIFRNRALSNATIGL
ncbi:hypothetical protein [Paenibacillus sp. MDMC362]|nr:hypothetical protein [Paenibacillus sp. MDMC362]